VNEAIQHSNICADEREEDRRQNETTGAGWNVSQKSMGEGVSKNLSYSINARTRSGPDGSELDLIYLKSDLE